MGYTVYKHTNKKNGKVYIGITGQDVKRRWQNGAGYYGTYFYNAIKKYGWDSFEHEILYKNLSEQDACKIEIELIKKYQSNIREHGYNIAEGGQAVHGSSERKGRLNHKSQRIICRDTDGKIVGEYESQNIAAKELGINRKGITKNCLGISKTYKGYVFEYASFDFDKPVRPTRGKHNNHRVIPVALLNENGEIIETFKSANEAGMKYKCSPTVIRKCCTGGLKTYKGRRWCYAV